MKGKGEINKLKENLSPRHRNLVDKAASELKGNAAAYSEMPLSEAVGKLGRAIGMDQAAISRLVSGIKTRGDAKTSDKAALQKLLESLGQRG